MRRSEEYQDLASECLDWARAAKSEHEQNLFLQIAEAWLQAAMAAGQREVQDAHALLDAHVH